MCFNFHIWNWLTKCPHIDDCRYYRKKSKTCNSIDPSFCGIYRNWEGRKDAWIEKK